eukprot:scaffold163596_cov32-Tisochrysis_lutea.AAC.2
MHVNSHVFLANTGPVHNCGGPASRQTLALREPICHAKALSCLLLIAAFLPGGICECNSRYGLSLCRMAHHTHDGCDPYAASHLACNGPPGVRPIGLSTQTRP